MSDFHVVVGLVNFDVVSRCPFPFEASLCVNNSFLSLGLQQNVMPLASSVFRSRLSCFFLNLAGDHFGLDCRPSLLRWMMGQFTIALH